MFGKPKNILLFPKDDLPTACSELDKIVRTECEKQGLDLNSLEPTMDLQGKRKNIIYTRYLRARNFRVEDCKNMILNSIKWRLVMKPGFVGTDDVDAVLKRDYVFFHEKDNEENPIVWVNVQNHVDFSDLFPVYQKFVLFMMEEGLRRSSQVLDEYDRLREEDILQGREPRPYPEPKATLVFDMRGFGMSNMDYSLVKFLAETLQAHYPEVLAHTYIVDSPWIFSTCWNIIKGWFDPVVSSKIEFVNRAQLLQKIDANKVPVMCGGTSIHTRMWNPNNHILNEAKYLEQEAKDLQEKAKEIQEAVINNQLDTEEKVINMENKIKIMEEEAKEIQEVVKNIQVDFKIKEEEEKEKNLETDN